MALNLDLLLDRPVEVLLPQFQDLVQALDYCADDSVEAWKEKLAQSSCTLLHPLLIQTELGRRVSDRLRLTIHQGELILRDINCLWLALQGPGSKIGFSFIDRLEKRAYKITAQFCSELDSNDKLHWLDERIDQGQDSLRRSYRFASTELDGEIVYHYLIVDDLLLSAALKRGRVVLNVKPGTSPHGLPMYQAASHRLFGPLKPIGRQEGRSWRWLYEDGTTARLPRPPPYFGPGLQYDSERYLCTKGIPTLYEERGGGYVQTKLEDGTFGLLREYILRRREGVLGIEVEFTAGPEEQSYVLPLPAELESAQLSLGESMLIARVSNTEIWSFDISDFDISPSVPYYRWTNISASKPISLLRNGFDPAIYPKFPDGYVELRASVHTKVEEPEVEVKIRDDLDFEPHSGQ